MHRYYIHLSVGVHACSYLQWALVIVATPVVNMFLVSHAGGCRRVVDNALAGLPL